MNTSATQLPDSLGSLSGSAFVERARKNVAKWGKQDIETLGLAIAEETGELCQAILKARWEGGDRERIRQEAIDLGALCHQVIFHLDHPPCPPCAACDSGDYQLGHSDHCPKSDPVFIAARARLERHFESKQNAESIRPLLAEYVDKGNWGNFALCGRCGDQCDRDSGCPTCDGAGAVDGQECEDCLDGERWWCDHCGEIEGWLPKGQTAPVKSPANAQEVAVPPEPK